MRLRLVIVVVFVLAIAVPGVIAYRSGVLPGPSPASADVASQTASPEVRVTSLAWPDQALGLAATDTMVVWEQRDRNKSVAGLWAYDVLTQLPSRLLGRSSTGAGAGAPSASGEIFVWAAWAARRGVGSPRIRGYDETTARNWTIAGRGRDPAVAGDTVVWVDRHGGATRADDAVRGVDTVTDETFSIPAAGRVRDVSIAGSWLAWTSGRGDDVAVWAGSHRDPTRYKLARAGTSVAIDRWRVVWAAKVGRRSTAIVSWNRHAKHSQILCRMPGSAQSLALGRRAVVWVSADETGDGDIWAFDFGSARAYAVCDHDAQQASPVIVSGTVFWADRRSGRWELYGRALQP